MKELAAVLDSAAFSETVQALAADSGRCGAREEDTISVHTNRGSARGFCVNERDMTRNTLDLVDQLEAPLIRELGSRYTTRAGEHARRGRNRA